MRFRKSPQILAMASLSSPQFAAKAISATGAFSAKWKPVRVKKTRQKQESRAPFRFDRNGALATMCPIFRAFLAHRHVVAMARELRLWKSAGYSNQVFSIDLP